MPTAAARPMGKVVGRQPATPRVIPSHPNPWYGGIVDGDPFTTQQRAELSRLSIDPAAVERMTVRRNASDAEMWWPAGSLPPVYQFECPVLGRRADGRVRIISPSGMGKLVFADGWVTGRQARKKAVRL
ncbi:hypothetical protein [Sphingomonas yantingensis]|uniref:Uncharacterized protein n=1 Tax=Sphingomonas yantingensis TaxID=1241761 RepID=A0A7W9AMQ6_9SPHN|nr:hypothetical protein [Sphingomonas yantingensis]MBB5697024.1 hypothetical protein [Sphingomonas yantingensis]